MLRLIIEAILVGLINLSVGSLLLYGTLSYILPTLKNSFNRCNRHYMFQLILFLSGIIIHILCEVTSINKWYCTNGNACSL